MVVLLGIIFFIFIIKIASKEEDSSTNETPNNASAFISPATLEALDVI